MGADLAGLAAPALRALSKGVESLTALIETMLYQLSVVIFMTGGSRVEDLWRAPISVWGRLREELEARGVNLERYTLKTRLEALLWRKGLAV